MGSFFGSKYPKSHKTIKPRKNTHSLFPSNPGPHLFHAHDQTQKHSALSLSRSNPTHALIYFFVHDQTQLFQYNFGGNSNLIGSFFDTIKRLSKQYKKNKILNYYWNASKLYWILWKLNNINYSRIIIETYQTIVHIIAHIELLSSWRAKVYSIVFRGFHSLSS